MSTVKIHFEGGTAEISRRTFADMLSCYINRLFDRQKEEIGTLNQIRLGDRDEREAKFTHICYQYDCAGSGLRVADGVDKAFNNRAVEPKHYVEPMEPTP